MNIIKSNQRKSVITVANVDQFSGWSVEWPIFYDITLLSVWLASEHIYINNHQMAQLWHPNGLFARSVELISNIKLLRQIY